METNVIYNQDNVQGLKEHIDDNSIDLTVTSPPYDDLRTYDGIEWKFEPLAKEIYKITKKGGIVVWVVGDKTVDGSETGSSFEQALYFKEIGFNLHDTMIYEKKTPVPLNSSYRYNQCFEYMFVLSKGKPKTTNIKQIPTKQPGKKYKISRDNATSNDNGAVNTKNKVYQTKETKNKNNIWVMQPVTSKEYHNHPAQFPEQLVKDHIKSWSNKGDIVLDPFIGSGTTAKMAKKLDRKYIGFEINKEYCEIAERRTKEIQKSLLTQQ